MSAFHSAAYINILRFNLLDLGNLKLKAATTNRKNKSRKMKQRKGKTITTN